MAAPASSPHRPDSSHGASTAAFAPGWLPPGGRDNGLAASSWAPIADIPAERVSPVLEALRKADIPAHAAPAPPPVRVLTPADRQRHPWRLRVASSSYSKAQDLLMLLLRARDR